MAPEMFVIGENEYYGKAVDYWSVGCIAYMILNKAQPFSRPLLPNGAEDDSDEGTVKLISDITSKGIGINLTLTAAANALPHGLLHRNPDFRMGAEELKRDPFLPTSIGISCNAKN